MRRLKKNLRNIETAVFVVLGISLLYLSFTEIAVLIQLPSARGDFLFVFGAGCIIVLSGFSLLMVKRITRTKIKRESGLFVLFVVLVSLLTFVFFNIFLKIGITASQLITLSIIVSTPLSCLAAGQTKKTFMDRLRRLGLNQGITLLTIFILATMPILPKWSFYFPQTAYVLPDLAFLNTPRTPSVNGEINSSGFFAEISVYENHTFEADNITQLTITNIGNNSVDLHFSVTEFMGGFEYLRDFRMFVMSQSKQVDILNFVNGLIRCNETVTLSESNDMLSFGVVVSGANRIASNTTLTINLAIFHQDIAIKNVHLLLEAETYEN